MYKTLLEIKKQFDSEYKTYDKEVMSILPQYNEINKKIIEQIKSKKKTIIVLDLGIGTGKLSELILKKFPFAKITGVDISKKMISIAKKRLGNMQVKFIIEDIAKFSSNKKYDLIVGVLSIHHLIAKNKKALYKKIYKTLNKNGQFIIGDLILGETKKETLKLESTWKKYLQKAFGKKDGEKWFKIYKEEDIPESILNQLKWLKQVGFKDPNCVWNKSNCAVIVGNK